MTSSKEFPEPRVIASALIQIEEGAEWYEARSKELELLTSYSIRGKAEIQAETLATVYSSAGVKNCVRIHLLQGTCE